MPKLDQIRLLRVQYVPKELEPGVLYVAEKFGAAVHLCACGCGRKVSTPLHPTEWSLEDGSDGPSLSPSIGNWEFPCKSHYWIRAGKIEWSVKWSADQIAAGRRAEEKRRRDYFEQPVPVEVRRGFWARVWRWIKSPFGIG
jgi:hypothetical protein